jgi:hypothetical protein
VCPSGQRRTSAVLVIHSSTTSMRGVHHGFCTESIRSLFLSIPRTVRMPTTRFDEVGRLTDGVVDVAIARLISIVESGQFNPTLLVTHRLLARQPRGGLQLLLREVRWRDQGR